MFYASLAEICGALSEHILDDLEIPCSTTIATGLYNTSRSSPPSTFLLARAQSYDTIERELARSYNIPTSLYVAGASAEDIEKALAPKPRVDAATKLPPHYHNFLPVFNPGNAKLLPPHRPDDHKIELMPRKNPLAMQAYLMSTKELCVL